MSGKQCLNPPDDVDVSTTTWGLPPTCGLPQCVY